MGAAELQAEVWPTSGLQGRLAQTHFRHWVCSEQLVCRPSHSFSGVCRLSFDKGSMSVWTGRSGKKNDLSSPMRVQLLGKKGDRFVWRVLECSGNKSFRLLPPLQGHVAGVSAARTANGKPEDGAVLANSKPVHLLTVTCETCSSKVQQEHSSNDTVVTGGGCSGADGQGFDSPSIPLTCLVLDFKRPRRWVGAGSEWVGLPLLFRKFWGDLRKIWGQPLQPDFL